MKKLYTFLLEFACVCSFAQIPTAALSGYYPFNGNTLDYVGTRHGVSYGVASYGTDRWGNSNSCYDVLNNSNHILLPNDNWVNGDYSVSAWVKIKATESYPRLYDFGNAYGVNNAIGKLSHAGNGSPSMEYYASSTMDGSYFLSTTVLVIGTWYHLVYISSGTQMKIYINNLLVGVYSGTHIPESIFRTSNKIGGSNAPLEDNTQAFIDDFRLYDRAIQPQEVTILYNEVENVTGVKNINNNLSQVSLYPNPSFNQLNLSLLSNKNQKASIKVIDNIGNLVMTYERELIIGQNIISSDIENLTSGFYFLSITSGDETQNFKFVKR